MVVNPEPLAYALQYAYRGWRVIWAPHGMKHPTMPQWQMHATTNGDIITDWWTKQPNANVCVATGEQSNLWVLDVDDKQDAGGSCSLASLETEHEQLPDTYSVLTWSGGMHFYFTWEGVDFDLRNSAGKLGKGLDTRGNGGQVVAPPSSYNGYRYALVTRTPPARAPDWLLGLLRPAPAPRARNWDSERWCEQQEMGGPAGLLGWLSSVQPGGQDDALAWAVRALRDDGMSRADAGAALWAVVKNWPCSRGEWTEQDVERHLRSAYR